MVCQDVVGPQLDIAELVIDWCGQPWGRSLEFLPKWHAYFVKRSHIVDVDMVDSGIRISTQFGWWMVWGIEKVWVRWAGQQKGARVTPTWTSLFGSTNAAKKDMASALYTMFADVLALCQAMGDDLTALLDPEAGFAPRLRQICHDR
jgi:hypothetical protein